LTPLVEKGELSELTAFEARYQYGKALNKGIVKTMSKMGVSTVASYVGSQLFEAVGVSEAVLARYFPGFHSRIGGVNLEHLVQSVLALHADAYHPALGEEIEITNHGEYQWRTRRRVAPVQSAHGPKAPARHAREAI